MPVRHRALTIFWSLLFATFGIGLALAEPALIGLSLFVAIPLAYSTYREVERAADLRLRWLYYLLVGLLFASAAGSVAGASMTVALDDARSPIGAIALGTTNVFIAILAWRALVRPSTRNAAGAGMCAVVFEIIAMVIDVFLNMQKHHVDDRTELGFAIVFIGASFSIATGALACFAALITFEPNRLDVPKARVL
jgi:hypothetical protein